MRPVFLLLFYGFPFFGLTAYAQTKKLDLDDMIIKGELHNDDRILLLSRQRNDLKNIINFRENFREEILQQIPKTAIKRKF